MSKVFAMDPTSELPWVPKCDRDLSETEQLTITYRPLDMRENAKLSDSQIRSTRKGNHQYLVNQVDIKRLEMCITGWKNFNYPENHQDKALAGKVVPFTKENIKMLPPEIAQEFITHITGRERVADEGDDQGEDLGVAEIE